MFLLKTVFIPALNFINILKIGINSPGCVPGTPHIKLLVEIDLSEKRFLSLGRSCESIWWTLAEKSVCWWQVLESEWQRDLRLLHCSLQQKRQNSNCVRVCVKGEEREGINCPGHSYIDSRNESADSRSVWQSLLETPPEVKLSCLVWQITPLEQNYLTFSFDIYIACQTFVRWK